MSPVFVTSITSIAFCYSSYSSPIGYSPYKLSPTQGVMHIHTAHAPIDAYTIRTAQGQDLNPTLTPATFMMPMFKGDAPLTNEPRLNFPHSFSQSTHFTLQSTLCLFCLYCPAFSLPLQSTDLTSLNFSDFYHSSDLSFKEQCRYLTQTLEEVYRPTNPRFASRPCPQNQYTLQTTFLSNYFGNFFRFSL